MSASGLVSIGLKMPEPQHISVTVTPSAREQFLKLRSQDPHAGEGLRITVQGGGCSGLMYGMEFDTPTERDQVIDTGDGLKVIVDPVSAQVLDGLEVDFVLSLEASGFKIKNPNAKSVCSCGKSFS